MGLVTNLFSSLKKRYDARFILDTDNYPDYSRDASEITFQPAALFFAQNENEIIDVINECRKNEIPIIFRGAGTGYTGGAVPSQGALVISLEKLKRLEVHQNKKMALVGPGVITKDLMDKSIKVSLFYPPDPASYDESTLGGNVAENAGGLHCKKYGVTKDYIIGLRGIDINGGLITTGIYNENELLDIGSLLIGSEGLLVAITEIAVRLIELPQFGPSILATFDRAENAARSVAEITMAGIIPSVMEYMDEDAIKCSMDYEQNISLESAAGLLLFETAGDNCISDGNDIENICKENGAILIKRETDKQQLEQLWSIRRNLSKAVKKSAKYKIAEDVAVPPSKLPELVSFVAQMDQEYPMRVNSYGHAGDGNLHVNFLTSDDSHVEEGLVDECILRLFQKTMSLEGTLTGEHGIGLTKKKYLNLEFDDPTIKSMKSIKSIFDPNCLFNPGKMFDM